MRLPSIASITNLCETLLSSKLHIMISARTESVMETVDINWLFETKALQVSPADSPFWYTSGLIGPYYINTHYLCGGEQRAKEVLELIDREAENRSSFPAAIRASLEVIEREHQIYRDTLAALERLAERAIDCDSIQYVSGGQRRDWIFSPLLAARLKKPCLYLYNDLTAINEQGQVVESLDGAVVLNVADLLTVGSSYTKKWIPAVNKLGGALKCALNVVDRNEGAAANLAAEGVQACESLFTIDSGFIDEALERGALDRPQHRMIEEYLADPFESMRAFLKKHPEFIRQAQESKNEKTRDRCALLLKEDPYQLDPTSHS